MTPASPRSRCSIGSVAVELARRIFPSLARCRVVVGAGKMGRVTARSLARAGVAEAIIRHAPFAARAEKLAEELGWIARPFADLDDLLVKADVVLTCTGAADWPILDQPAPARGGEAQEVPPAVHRRHRGAVTSS